MSIDRRAFLQSTAALATLSAAGCATVEKAPQQMAKASAARINTSALKSNADAILAASAKAGDVPGVVAVATNRTAGFSYSLWNKDIGKYEEVKKVPGIITCQNAALTTPLIADPGEQWNYGINIDYAGKMVEAVSGMRLGDYFAKNIFKPLGGTRQQLLLDRSTKRRGRRVPVAGPAVRRREIAAAVLCV